MFNLFKNKQADNLVKFFKEHSTWLCIGNIENANKSFKKAALECRFELHRIFGNHNIIINYLKKGEVQKRMFLLERPLPVPELYSLLEREEIGLLKFHTNGNYTIIAKGWRSSLSSHNMDFKKFIDHQLDEQVIKE